jgi:hypothetical protein
MDVVLVHPIRHIILLLRQRVQLHGPHLIQSKVLLHIGLWEAEAAAVAHMIIQAAAAVAEVLL